MMDLGDVSPGGEKMGRPHSEMLERGEKEKRNDPKAKEEKEQNP